MALICTLIFCLYEFGSPDLKRGPSHWFHLWPRQEPIRCCWHRVGFMWASCGQYCLKISQGPQGQKGFWGIHQINGVCGGEGLKSHLRIWRDVFVLSTVVCLIWFLVLWLLDPFQPTVLRCFCLSWFEIFRISLGYHRKKQLAIFNTWSFPWLTTPQKNQWGSTTKDPFSYRFNDPIGSKTLVVLEKKVQRPLWHGWNGGWCLDFVVTLLEAAFFFTYMCERKALDRDSCSKTIDC